MIITRQEIIKRLDRQLMEVYACELISLVLSPGLSSHWYNARREGLHKELTRILSHDEI